MTGISACIFEVAGTDLPRQSNCIHSDAVADEVLFKQIQFADRDTLYVRRSLTQQHMTVCLQSLSLHLK